MEPVKVIIESVTKMKRDALLYPQSGLLKIGSEWSCLAHEKAFNHSIFDYVRPAKAPESSPGPSGKGNKKK